VCSSDLKDAEPPGGSVGFAPHPPAIEVRGHTEDRRGRMVEEIPGHEATE
jgi:hypothetical protein